MDSENLERLMKEGETYKKKPITYTFILELLPLVLL